MAETVLDVTDSTAQLVFDIDPGPREVPVWRMIAVALVAATSCRIEAVLPEPACSILAYWPRPCWVALAMFTYEALHHHHRQLLRPRPVEHGGDPSSIHFFEKVGLDYVSCSPYRVPVARLAAAQAGLSVKVGD